MRSLRMVPKNISVRFQHSPMKTVGGDRKSAKKWPKMTSLSPVPVEPLFGRPRDLCPDASFFYVHIHERFRSNRSMGKWSKKGNRRTSGRTYWPRRLLAPVVVDLVVASSSVHRSLVGFKRILSVYKKVLMHESCRPIFVELCWEYRRNKLWPWPDISQNQSSLCPW